MTGRGRKPKGSAYIAGEDEVLECLTSVLRGTDAQEMKIAPRDRLRAAELLAKRYGTLGVTEAQVKPPRIIDDIPATADEDD